MWFYLILLVMTCLANLVIRPSKSNRRKAAFLISVFGVLGVVAALRAPWVGADTMQYYRYYSVIGNLNWEELGFIRYEWGYSAFCKLLYSISQEPQTLIIVSSLFIVISIGVFVHRCSKDAFLSVVIYICCQVYTFNLSTMRQSIAIAIILLFIPSLLKGKTIPFVAGVILSAQFHTTSWIYLLLPFIIRFRFTPKIVAVFIFAALIGYFASVPLLNFIGGMSGHTYGDYLINPETGGGKFGSVLTFGFYLILLFAQLYCSRYCIAGKAPAAQIERSQLAAGMTVPTGAMGIATNAFLRLTYSFSPLLIISLPNSLQLIPNKREAFLVKLLVVAFVFTYFVLTLTREGWFMVVPYEVFF